MLARHPFTLAVLATVALIPLGCDDGGADAVDAADARGTDADAAGSPADAASNPGGDPADAGPLEMDAGPDAAAAAPRVMGPGLGNLAYAEDELFVPLSFIDQDNGIPASNNAFRFIKPFATNMAYMHNGWFFTQFASDSGWPGGGLLFYDVSDPREPVLLNRVYELFADGREDTPNDRPDMDRYDGRTGDFREQHSIAFTTVGDQDLAMLHTGRGIEIWDLRDPMAPHRVGALALPGVAAGDYKDVAWQLSWQGRHAYIAGSNDGMWIVDTTDPANPVLADRGRGGPNPVPPGELGGFRIGPVFAVGNRLVVSSMDTSGGYAVADISDPVNPVLQSALTSGFEKFYSICFSGHRIVGSVRGEGARMTVHDASDPFAIARVDDDIVLDKQLYCGTQDQFVFSGNEDDFAKVDVSTPGAFEVVGRGTLGRTDADHGQMSPFGNLLFVGDDHGKGSGFVPHQADPDTTPPALTMVDPPDGATQLAATARIGFTFSDAIDNTSVTTETISVTPAAGGAPVPGRFALQGQIVNFTPDEPLDAGVSYAVTVHAGGVRDWAGNAFAETAVSTFEVSALSPDDAGRLSVDLTAVGPVEVGQPVTLEAAVDGPGPVELAWRFGDGSGWTPFGSDTAVTHTYAAPGHMNVVVQATNGPQRAVASLRLTVHRPLVGATAGSSAIALDEARGEAWVANRDQGTITRVDVATGSTLAEVEVGAEPTSVTRVAADQLWVTVAGADRLAVLTSDGASTTLDLPHGSAPCASVPSADGAAVFVLERGTGDLARWDPSTREESARARVAGPGACALSRGPDGRLWVAGFYGGPSGAPLYEVDPETLTVLRTVTLANDTTTTDGEDRSRGVPNYLQSPAIGPDGAMAWIPAVQANLSRGHLRDGQSLNHEATVRAIAPRVDLASGAEVDGPRLDFNDRAGPMAAVTTPLGDYVFVALMGSDAVVIADAYSGATVGEFTVGGAPRSLALSADGTRLYVHAWLDRRLRVYDTSEVITGAAYAPPLAESVPLVEQEALDATVLAGKRLFNLAGDARMSKDGYLSCASCHLDGGHDGQTWDFTERGEGLRNTTDLRGRAGTAHGPVHWTANFDEIQDFEHDIRSGFGGAGFLDDGVFHAGGHDDPLGTPKAGLSAQLDALAAYVGSLAAFPRSPHRRADGTATEAGLRGAEVFAALECGACHAGEAMTDSGEALHDVGTATEASGARIGGPLTGFDTPTLRGLWDGAPYLHDGSAADLEAVLVDRNPSGQHGAIADLAPGALADLIQYLLELE